MLGNFFNRMYYGKAGKGDFNPEHLPANRIQLFFQMLRVRWSALVRLNLLYVLFWLPAILWTGLNIMTAMGVLNGVAAGELTDIEANAQLMGLLRTWLMILTPCIAITGPATAGASYVTRNWARDEHSFMWSDFKDAMKSNWKQALVVSMISGIAPLLVYVSYYVYGGFVDQYGVGFAIPQIIVILLGVLWMLSQQMVYTLMVTYKLSFKNLMKNAALLSIGKLPLSIGIKLVTWIVPGIAALLFLFVPSVSVYALLFMFVYYVFFGLAFNRFVYASYANGLCEKYINPQIEGAEVGMGLRKTTEDDYEIDPTLPQPPGIMEEMASKDEK